MTKQENITAFKSTARLGPLWLMPGIGRINAISFFFVAALNNIVFSFIHFMQPYVFEIQLQIPDGEQGVLVGSLSIMQELLVIFLTGLAGALADKFGRRIIFCSGLIFISVAYSLYPLAESTAMLYLARVFFAIGIAGASTVMFIFTGDYSQESSRGKWVGLQGFMLGIGALTSSLLLTKVPGFLQEYGIEPIPSIGATMFLAAFIAVVAAIIGGFGLKPGTQRREIIRRQPLSKLLMEGFKEARANPRVSLSYAASLAARGDLVVVGGFMFLWIVRYSVDHDLNVQQGYARGQLIVPLITGMFMLSGPIMGFLLDKIDRVAGVIIAFCISTVGYIFMGLIQDPLGNTIFAAAVVLGLGEGTCLLSSIALMGQNAPPKVRGSVFGTFATCGALGMLMAAGIGGYLFDNWLYTGPYLFMGFVNAVVVIFGVIVWVKYPHVDHRKVR